MNQERRTCGSKVAVAAAILGFCILLWFLFQKDGRDPGNSTNQPGNSTNALSSTSALVIPAGGLPNRINATGGTRVSPSTAQTSNSRVDKETMLRQLKGWIQRREGYDVEIVAAQDVFDSKGTPASLNVIVTSQLNGHLTAQDLKVQLDEAFEKEQRLRKQLAKAHREEDIASANRLVAELVESRTAFVTNNGVSSYKLSLLKDLPPVLAFWPGMPFETVREGSARALAETKLGPEVGLHGLVHFTSAAAVLQFTNRAGASVFVDPFRMTEIPADVIQNARSGARLRDPEGREARISSQWAEYLQQ